MRFFALTLLGSACLAGCGALIEDTPTDILLSRLQASEEFPRYTAAVEAASPVLQVGFIDSGLATNLRLERRHSPYEYWLSVDGVHLVLQDGMLHSTRGLGETLLASEISEPLAQLKSLQDGSYDRFHTFLDSEDRAVTRTYRCDIQRTRETTIPVAGGEIDTLLFRESCNSLDQQFENLYWVDPRTRQIVQSRQWASPLVGAMSTRIVLE